MTTKSKNVLRARSIALALCITVATYFTVAGGYALIHYADYASDTPRLLRYVLAPACLAVLFLAIGFLIRTNIAIIIGTVSVSVLATLFLFEGFLTVRSFGSILGLVGHTSDGSIDTSEFHASLPPSYTFGALNETLGVQDLDKAILAGVPNQPVFLCSKGGNPVSYRADRYGFRNPKSVYDAPADVVVLGDSFVEGICLEDGEDVVSQVRNLIPQTIGTGTRGTGPLFQLAVLGRYGPIFRPPVTLKFFFAGNDWENLNAELNRPWLTDALKPGAEFGAPALSVEQRENMQQTLEEWWSRDTRSMKELLSRRSTLRNFFALQKTALVLGLHYPKASGERPEFEAILRRSAQLTDTWNGEFFVVYVPPLDRYAGVLNSEFAFDPLRLKVLTAAQNAGVEVIDIAEVFAAQSNPLELYAADSHFSPAGAKLVAETIAARIQPRLAEVARGQ